MDSWTGCHIRVGQTTAGGASLFSLRTLPEKRILAFTASLLILPTTSAGLLPPLRCTALLAVLTHTKHVVATGPLRQMLPWPETLFLGVCMAHSLPSTMPLLNWHLINLSMRLYSSSLIKYESQPLIQYPVYLDLFFLFYLHHLTYYILLAYLFIFCLLLNVSSRKAGTVFCSLPY